jgi:hypothetical protein
MTLSVKEYLWGYQDPLLKQLKSIIPDVIGNDQVSLFGSTVSIVYVAFLS